MRLMRWDQNGNRQSFFLFSLAYEIVTNLPLVAHVKSKEQCWNFSINLMDSTSAVPILVSGVYIDHFMSLGDVKVIMATNKIETLDPALIRPGRIDR